ncbi:potassium-transporting ATPase subunit C [Oerskovia sp. M15]
MPGTRSTPAGVPGRPPLARPSASAGAASLFRQTLAGLRVLLVLTLLLGVTYPLAVWGVGQLALPWQANGSLVRSDGSHATSIDDTGTGGEPVVGSALIGQDFAASDDAAAGSTGAPRPRATGTTRSPPPGPTSAPQRGPRRLDHRAPGGARGPERRGPASLPADALTASASGLDPQISPEYAALQVARVAESRGLDEAVVADLVAAHTAGGTSESWASRASTCSS